MWDAVDLFAGPGGWDVAARALGLRTVGLEKEHDPCLTRVAAGLHAIECDVRTRGPLEDKLWARGLIASPPCPTFSKAGHGTGRLDLDLVVRLAHTMAQRVSIAAELASLRDSRTGLVLEPLRWALEAIDGERPYEWIALEQVPSVGPVWEAFAEILRAADTKVLVALQMLE